MTAAVSPDISPEGLVRLKDAIDGFRAHPETHKQAAWICDTGCCVAGSVVLAAGAVPTSPGRTANVIYRGALESVDYLARKLLGINVEVAFQLFAADNTLDTLQVMYDLLAAGESLVTECFSCGYVVASQALMEALPDNDFEHCHD